jgi:hypothetical protein
LDRFSHAHDLILKKSDFAKSPNDQRVAMANFDCFRKFQGTTSFTLTVDTKEKTERGFFNQWRYLFDQSDGSHNDDNRDEASFEGLCVCSTSKPGFHAQFAR